MPNPRSRSLRSRPGREEEGSEETPGTSTVTSKESETTPAPPTASANSAPGIPLGQTTRALSADANPAPGIPLGQTTRAAPPAVLSAAALGRTRAITAAAAAAATATKTPSTTSTMRPAPLMQAAPSVAPANSAPGIPLGQTTRAPAATTPSAPTEYPALPAAAAATARVPTARTTTATPAASAVPTAPRSFVARSLSRRSERMALIELQRKKLEEAQLATALAQSEYELALEYASEVASEDIDNSIQVERWVEDTTKIETPCPPVEEEVQPPPQPEKYLPQLPPPEKKEESSLNLIRELADAITLRNSESMRNFWPLPDFDGTAEEWLPFVKTYEESAAAHTDSQNTARLRKALKGVAKEAVRSLLYAADDPGIIMKTLERRFGRPDDIVDIELQKLKALSKPGDNPRDVIIFASRLSNAVATIKALKKPFLLHSPEVGKTVIDKLSALMRYRWYDFSTATTEEEPILEKLERFLNREADICGSAALPEKFQRKGRQTVSASQKEDEQAANTTTVPSCRMCEGTHYIKDCAEFKKATVDARWEVARDKKLCFKCLRGKHSGFSCRTRPCVKCKGPHHLLLHNERPAAPHQQKKEEAAEKTEPAEMKNVVTNVYAATVGTRAYLKMVPVDLYGPEGSTRVLALLDEGSTVTLLEARIAEKIGATGEEEKLVLQTVGGKVIKCDSQRMDLLLKGAHRRDKHILRGARTVEDLRLSPQHIDEDTLESYSHLREIKEELFYSSERPALLIGQDNWDLIISRKVQKGKPNEPVASLTSLGWVLHGRASRAAEAVNFLYHCRLTEEENMEEMMKRHFDLEAIGIQPRRPSNDADGRALEVLEKTTKRLPEGRFETGLLWKSDGESLPFNYKQAYNRLVGIEKKLQKDATLKAEYQRQIENLLSSGYAEKAPATSTTDRTFYLPHFAVTHPVKKKVRLVFDAAAKFEGKSLNDALLPGPDLLQSFGVLLRFREGPVAVVADIREMFLQIRIREEDRDSLRFLWRDETAAQPKEFRMKSVIFGAASSPSTAIFIKNKNAEEHAESFPRAARAIMRHHYMDDYLQSFGSIEEAVKVAKQVSKVHKAAGFELRQWASNQIEALAELEHTALREKTIGEEKTLGMRWLVEEDALAYHVGLRNTPPEVVKGSRFPTKREVTAAVMSTFDPMGLIAPVLLQGKRLVQELWRAEVKWDEKITDQHFTSWLQYLEKIKTLHELRVPRCMAPDGTKSGELHTFVDASETAYAAAVYWRTTTAEGTRVTLMAGKAKVAPVKTTSIPRLELQAALLGARLADSISKETDFEVISKTYWSDSTTVLQWLKADPRRFKTFVAHRLAGIEELSKPNEWRWVPTKDNPADDATREVPKDFCGVSRWFIGPAFLHQPEREWPVKKLKENQDPCEETKRDACCAVRIAPLPSLPNPCKFSSWTRLLRATSRVFLFLDLCRRKISRDVGAKGEKPSLLPINEGHLQRAQRALVQQSQREAFASEISELKKKGPIQKSSRLKKIEVELDENDILRLKIRTSKLSGEERKPPVLDGKGRLASLLIDHYHRKLHHGSSATVVNELRQKFWIISLRNAVRKVVRQCQWCIVRRAKPEVPPQGDLPAERLAHHQPPFTCTGVDYFGPMQVTIGRRREKRWGALFTCLTTRAVHLELANSLSTSSMLMALRRMAARRGSPRVIFSDNGTNFVGANRELRDEVRRISPNEYVEAAEKEGITWKFIPPGAPHMGGAWERLVRSVKTALITVLGERSLPEEVLHTYLAEVEHTVNSRPLTHLSADPGDEESLTPNHFLIGRSCGAAILEAFDERTLVGTPSWRTAQHLADHFWARWLKEYLPTLRPRAMKSRQTAPELKQGDVVIIADSTFPRNTWPRGVVVAVYPGRDGRLRIVDVRTRGGVVRRPVSRLIPIALSPNNGVPGKPGTRGETVNNAY